MLKRVRIQGYKSLADVEVCLEPLCVLFGPNASGKSNFLDALQLLSRIASTDSLGAAFGYPHRGKPIESFTFGPGGVKELVTRERIGFSIEVDVELSPRIIEAVNSQAEQFALEHLKPVQITQKRLRYQIRMEFHPQKAWLYVADERLTALDEEGNERPDVAPFIYYDEGSRPNTRVETGSPSMYSRSLDKRYPWDHTQSTLSKFQDATIYPHGVALRRELASWRFFYLEPREIMRITNLVDDVRQIGMRGEKLGGFLYALRAQNESKFRAIERAFRTMIPSAAGIEVGINPSTAEVEFGIREGDTVIPSAVLSDGTLRVLGLLAVTGANGTPPALIGFEEPENGLHPRRIRSVAEFLGTQAALGEVQTIVTTHSPILLDLIPSECLYLCRRRDGKTTIEPFLKWSEGKRRKNVRKALDHEEIPVSKLMLRGDLDD